jgi:hypothetical protein
MQPVPGHLANRERDRTLVGDRHNILSEQSPEMAEAVVRD